MRLGPVFASISLVCLACSSTPEPAPGGERQASEQASEGFPPGPYEDRDPKLAKRLVEAGALLLDVRTAEEFAAGHVEGALNIDHSQVPARLEEIEGLVEGDRHRPIVVYCRSGRRSGMAKQALEAAGFDRVTNLGGYRDWPD